MQSLGLTCNSQFLRRHPLAPTTNYPSNWSPPPTSFVKLNFDGASKGNPSLAGLGGVFRDHQGQILRTYSKGQGIATNNKVKLGALNQGLLIAIKEGMQKLIVEGDSLIDICSLKKLIHGSAIGKISTSWRLEAGLEHLKQLLTSIDVVIPSQRVQ
jgi:ribonuclease HI